MQTRCATSARTTLRCSGGGDGGDTCLSDAQLAVVDTWNAPKTFAGTYVNPGWPLTGSESSPNNWDVWMFGGAQFAFQYGAISGFLLRDPATGPVPPQDATAVNTLFYDFNAASSAAALATVSAAVDATNPDLRPFMNSGGKVLFWHGASDPALTVRGTTGYYQNVVAAVGGQANADSFARYYIAPGVNHCRSGPGATKSDLLTALDAWVSNGTAPATLSAAQLAADGSSNFTRPLCVYPQYPRYTGPAGDASAAKLAASYTCTTP